MDPDAASFTQEDFEGHALGALTEARAAHNEPAERATEGTRAIAFALLAVARAINDVAARLPK